MDLTMKITIEAHGRTYTAELEDDIGALNDAVRGLLVAVGYHTDTVDDYFPHWEDYQEGCRCEGYPITYVTREELEEQFGDKIKQEYEQRGRKSLEDAWNECGEGFKNFDDKESGRSFGI